MLILLKRIYHESVAFQTNDWAPPDRMTGQWEVEARKDDRGGEEQKEKFLRKKTNFPLQLKGWRENMENFCGSKPPEGGCGSRQAQGFYPLWQPTASVFHGNRRFADCDPIAQFDRFDPRTTIGLPLEVRAVSRALDFLIPVSEALPQRGTRDSNPQPRVPTRSQNRKRPNAQSHRANGGPLGEGLMSATGTDARGFLSYESDDRTAQAVRPDVRPSGAHSETTVEPSSWWTVHSTIIAAGLGGLISYYIFLFMVCSALLIPYTLTTNPRHGPTTTDRRSTRASCVLCPQMSCRRNKDGTVPMLDAVLLGWFCLKQSVALTLHSCAITKLAPMAAVVRAMDGSSEASQV
ncbi:LOW QUALITY PROTEIN: Lipoprotein signal peptidase [Frankliniella fusca]|uniref:Lipoprotein signal peptidase n=1 Tax=Frankliniella fusca TaxID=407009 RepID=A0AAE1GTM2_9NEOP|nr:LOW QUALITY PROTEIN: Lipoprotein signal peptidase [Frankliniella fusca]